MPLTPRPSELLAVLRPELFSTVNNILTSVAVGSRIIAAPTTALAVDITETTTDVWLRERTAVAGDILMIDGHGHSEWWLVVHEILSSKPNYNPPYHYEVTRNYSGSGAWAWTSGDPVFNTGQAGSGFIELFSNTSIRQRGDVGPALAVWERNDSVWNNFGASARIGNLQGARGYNSKAWGAWFGRYDNNSVWWSVDDTNGIRVMRYGDTIGQWANNGTFFTGSANDFRFVLDPVQHNLRIEYQGTPKLVLDAESMSLIGLTRWGNPHGPALEAGAVTDANGNVRQVIRALRDNGVVGVGIGTGTETDPNDVYMVLGAEGDTNYLRYIAGVLAITGIIHATGGSFTGPVNILGPTGALTWADGKGVADNTGIQHVEDANNYWKVKPISGHFVEIVSNYGHTGLYVQETTGFGIDAYCTTGTGVQGTATSGAGVKGIAGAGVGVKGVAGGIGAVGVLGEISGATSYAAVEGFAHAGYAGVVGVADSSTTFGVVGINLTSNGVGVVGLGKYTGVSGFADANGGMGILGTGAATDAIGVYGTVGSAGGLSGVKGVAESADQIGVHGYAYSSGGVGILAEVSDAATTALQISGGIVDGGSQRYTALADATAATDALNRQTGDARYVQQAAYKKYVALLTQSGTAAPSATVLENTLGGTVIWTHDDDGTYSGTLTGVFTTGKTVIFFNPQPTANYNARAFWQSADVVSILAYETTISGAALVETPTDWGLSGASIEIRVYP